MARPSLKAPAHFSVISSYDQWSSKEAMVWDNGVFRYRGRLVAPGQTFQILREGSKGGVVYPSVNNATPLTAHVLRGPDQKGHGLNWAVVPREGEQGEVELLLSCPKGYPLGITWLRGGKAPQDAVQALDVASDREGQLKLFQQNFGAWTLQSELGRGKQRGAVFLAQGRTGKAAVKFPVSVREIQHLSALQGVPGVPELLDFNNGPNRGPYHVMPVLGDSLESLLLQRDDAGFLGRISWPAACGLGACLLETLQGIHARGVVHCDISAMNVLVGPSCRPFLIDFGLSRVLGSAEFERGEGTVEFNSIRASYPGQRKPADDLESLGWLLWRCVVGPLPWHGWPREVAWSDRQARQGVHERVAKAKARLLEEGFACHGERWAFCPDGLKEYLVRARQESSLERLEPSSTVYRELAALLECPDGRARWADVATRKPPNAYESRGSRLIWSPRATGSRAMVAQEATVPQEVRVVTTERTELVDGGLWAELDPIYLPGLPHDLLHRGAWVLVADWAEHLLQPLSSSGGVVAHGQAGVSAQEDGDEEEEDKLLLSTAARAAQQYSKSKRLYEPDSPR